MEGMLLLSCAMLLMPPPPGDIAFSARYYKEGSTPTYHQIYLSDLRGTAKQQLTRNGFPSYAPMWLDRDNLAFVEAYGRVPSKGDGENGKVKSRVVALNLSTGVRRVVENLPLHDELLDGIWARGRRFELDDSGPDNASVTTTYEVSAQGAKVVPNDETQMWAREFGEDDQDDGESRSYLYRPRYAMFAPVKGPVWSLRWRIQEFDDPVPGTHLDQIRRAEITLNSIRSSARTAFKLQGDHVQDANLTFDDRGLIVTSYIDNKYRQDHFLYRVNKDFTKVDLVSKGVGFIEINPGHPFWKAGHIGRKEGAMEKLKDGKAVYVNWLYTGNWQTGEQWTIAKGLVEVGSSQFRPTR